MILFNVLFDSQASMALAAHRLLDCHPHHFSVRADIQSLEGLSSMALDQCLADRAYTIVTIAPKDLSNV